MQEENYSSRKEITVVKPSYMNSYLQIVEIVLRSTNITKQHNSYLQIAEMVLSRTNSIEIV